MRAIQIAKKNGPLILVDRPLPEPKRGEVRVRVEASGTSIESEDTLRFSALTGVKPMIEVMPLEKAPEACARMMSGEARFRMVLSIAA